MTVAGMRIGRSLPAELFTEFLDSRVYRILNIRIMLHVVIKVLPLCVSSVPLALNWWEAGQRNEIFPFPFAGENAN